ncbi:MAG: hypothetical protein IAF94_26305 [Pirellulaceae bacterium]|nr:hypothetical protein [Pirellulaceae bacterium]
MTKPPAKLAETKEGKKEEKQEEKSASDLIAPKVRALIKQLDASEQAKREAAEKELIALGQDVLPLLPKPDARTPAEVKNRLRRVYSALLAAAVEASTKPAFVTLSGEMTLSEAMAAIEKQTGNKVVDKREEMMQETPDPKVTLALEKVPFWQALDTVLDAANLQLYNYDVETGALAYVARGEGSLPRSAHGSYGGLFRLEPTKLEATSDLRNPMNKGLRLTVDVAWEPRVRPVVLELAPGDMKGTDDAGGELTSDAGGETLEFPVRGTNAGVELELGFQLPPRSVKQIASIKGKMSALVLGRVEEFEFTDLEKAKGVEQERGGVTVVVREVRKNEEIFDVKVRVKFGDAGKALESHQGWIYDNECYLLDKSGNRIEVAGLEANSTGANEVGLDFKFDLGDETSAKGYKFIYKTPAAIVRIPIEFELKNIELP